MTRFAKTVLTITSIVAAIAGSSTAAHAGDTFTASFSYDKTASAQSNLESFKKTASLVCSEQLTEAGFRKTETTSYQHRKCLRQLVKDAVKGTDDRILMSLYQADVKGVKRVQMAMNN